jgi:hypothetical protein
MRLGAQREEELKGMVALAYHCYYVVESDYKLSSKFSKELAKYRVTGLYQQIITRFLVKPDELKGRRSEDEKTRIGYLLEKRELMAHALEWLWTHKELVQLPINQSQIIALLDRTYVEPDGTQWHGGIAGKVRANKARLKAVQEADELSKRLERQAKQEAMQEEARRFLAADAKAHNMTVIEYQAWLASQRKKQLVKEKLQKLGADGTQARRVEEDDCLYCRINGTLTRLDEEQTARLLLTVGA